MLASAAAQQDTPPSDTRGFVAKVHLRVWWWCKCVCVCFGGGCR
jgi:hypothetical protein